MGHSNFELLCHSVLRSPYIVVEVGKDV